MEQLKVKKKDILVMNLVLFMGLSFIFLYLQYAYRNHLSPFSLAYLRKSVELFWYVSVPVISSVVLIWRLHKWAIPVYSFCAFLISFKVVEGLFIEFNKIIVIALFCYVVIAYFLYQLFKHYVSMASLNPNYSQDDLFNPLLKSIPCRYIQKDEEIDGHLTNWDDEGCFIKLDSTPKHLDGHATLSISFQGRTFEQEGEVVAQSVDLTGIGIKFGRTQKGLNVFNWAEFDELIHELGYIPERLR